MPKIYRLHFAKPQLQRTTGGRVTLNAGRRGSSFDDNRVSSVAAIRASALGQSQFAASLQDNQQFSLTYYGLNSSGPTDNDLNKNSLICKHCNGVVEISDDWVLKNSRRTTTVINDDSNTESNDGSTSQIVKRFKRVSFNSRDRSASMHSNTGSNFESINEQVSGVDENVSIVENDKLAKDETAKQDTTSGDEETGSVNVCKNATANQDTNNGREEASNSEEMRNNSNPSSNIESINEQLCDGGEDGSRRSLVDDVPETAKLAETLQHEKASSSRSLMSGSFSLAGTAQHDKTGKEEASNNEDEEMRR